MSILAICNNSRQKIVTKLTVIFQLKLFMWFFLKFFPRERGRAAKPESMGYLSSNCKKQKVWLFGKWKWKW